MGLEPHLTPPILYSKHFHICSADATRSSRGLRQASTTSAHRMDMLADTAGSADTEVMERSSAGERRWACTRTTERHPPPHALIEGGRRGSEPPWTDPSHVAAGAPMTLTDTGNRWSSPPTAAIRIESKLRLSPRVLEPGLTRGDFRQLSMHREHASESPLISPGASASGPSLSYGSTRIGAEGGVDRRLPAWLGCWARLTRARCGCWESSGGWYATRAGEESTLHGDCGVRGA